jgi:hypothetical protein
VTHDDLTPPEAWQRCADKRELLRTAARSMLQNPRLDPLSRPWAEFWANYPEDGIARAHLPATAHQSAPVGVAP